MDAPNAQPTILVKKADGTFARMTLDEVKKMRQGAPASVSSQVIQKSFSPSAREGVHGGEGVSSNQLSSTKKTPSSPASPPQSGAPDTISKVIAQLPFSVPPDLQNRLRTIVQLYIKEVRDERQTRSAAMRKVLDGGLALSAAQTDTLIDLCNTVSSKPQHNVSVPTLKELKSGTVADPSLDETDVPMKYAAAAAPAVASPNNNFVHDTLRPVSSKEAAQPKPREEKFSLRPASPVKPTMHDITATAPSMGPAEEIRYFSLTDFRRLSFSPKESAARLRQLFTNLEEESVMLYLDGLEAWRKSPLYQSYVSLVSEALVTRKTVEQAAKERKSIEPAEVAAIIEMEDTLPYL